MRSRVRGVLPAIVVALLMTQLTTRGWPIWPWHPRLMDLMVYQHGGRVVLEGGDLLTSPDPSTIGLVFTYPPFAALLAVPLALLPTLLLGFLWIAATAIALYAVLHRFGLRGWMLSVVTAAAFVVVEPLRSTLHFGQVNVFLMAMVALDLLRDRVPPSSSPSCPKFPTELSQVPHRVVPSSPRGASRWIPAGVLTGAAAAIKLTPGLFVPYLLFAKRWGIALAAAVTALLATAIAWIVLPEASKEFFAGLLHGDNRTGYLENLVNQSITGALTRFGISSTIALAISVLVAIAGVWAAGRWDRRGERAFAVALCGCTAALVSPVSWNHHFVWVLPLAIVLSYGRNKGEVTRHIPAIIRITGLVFAGWAAIGIWKFIGPFGHHEELAYALWQQAAGAMTAILGIVFVATTFTASTQPRRGPTDREPGGEHAVSWRGSK